MEKVINKLNEVKEDLINYIIDVANQNKLSYLFVEYNKQDNVKLYHIEIDNKFYITEDIIYRLKSFNIELLAKFCAKVKQDLNKKRGKSEIKITDVYTDFYEDHIKKKN